jgi:DNA-binding transcriptional regulator YdaS (Cro superfamily)
MQHQQKHDALKVAVSLAGGQTALAEICNCKKQSINEALRHKRGLPAQYVNVVSEKLKIPRHVLRPDLYPMDKEPHVDG